MTKKPGLIDISAIATLYTKERKYWLDKLAGSSPKNGFSRDLYPEQGIVPFENLHGELPEALALRLDKVMNGSYQRLHMILCAALYALLYKYVGHSDVVLLTPIYHKRQETDPLNTLLLLRNQFGKGQTFRELLLQVRENMGEAIENQNYPVETLLYHLSETLGVSEAGSFEVSLVLDNIQEVDYLPLGSENILLRFEKVGREILFSIRFNPSIYVTETIARIKGLFERLLGIMLEDVDMPIEDIDLLNEEERSRLLYEFIQPTDTAGSITVVGSIQKRAARDPDNIALTYGNAAISYRDLNGKANQVARYLRQCYDIQQGKVIGLMVERSDLQVIALLAILKTSAAYLPIEADLPGERIRYMIENSGCRIVIGTRASGNVIDPGPGVLLLDIDSIVEGASLYPKDDLSADVDIRSLAYIIYTSGSTGKPKGCQIGHDNLQNYLDWAIGFYFQDRGKVNFPLFSSLSFDFTVTSIFCPLLTGGLVRIYPQEVLTDAILFDVFSAADMINAVKLTPSHINLLQYLPVRGSRIGSVIVGGEALTAKQVAVLNKIKPGIRIYNEYGPTETTIGCIVKEVSVDDERILIGRPIANTSIYIVDERLRLVPVGFPGEILIGGNCVGRGYISQAAMTEERFIPSPFCEGNVFRTGDAARWLENGEIEFLGRKDTQLKVNGYRIEAGEVEQRLLAYGPLKEASVVKRKSVEGDESLVAYYVSDVEISVAVIRQYLLTLLPKYMVPDVFMRLDKMPLTVNGKTDKTRLEQLSPVQKSSQSYVAPRNELEGQLAAIWQKILRYDRVGVYDNFFEMGGHSLKASQLVSRIQETFDVQLQLKELFELASIDGLARVIGKTRKVEHVPIERAAMQPYYALSHAQRRLWVLCQFDGATEAYNVPGAYQLEMDLDRAAFGRAFQALIERHESLRTCFCLIDGVPMQKIVSPRDCGFQIRFEDLRTDEHRDQRARAYAEEEIVQPFVLDRGPLIRSSLLQVEDHVFVFLLTLHHIVSDDWSMDVLVKEILTLYDTYKRGEEDGLPPLPIQYKDYAAWQNRQLGEERGVLLKDYWLSVLSGELPVLNLPADKKHPVERTFGGGMTGILINRQLTRELRRMGAEKEVSMFMLLVSAINILLYRYTCQSDILIGTLVAGRNHVDLEGQIGFYVNTLVLRMQLDNEDSFASVIARFRDVALGAFDHQDYPFDLLVDELHLQRDASMSPVFGVMVAYQNKTEMAETGFKDFGNVQVNPFDLKSPVSKFDLTFSIVELAETVVVNAEYSTDLYEEETIRRMLEHYGRLLGSAVADPGRRVGELELLGAGEREWLLRVGRGVRPEREGLFDWGKVLSGVMAEKGEQEAIGGYGRGLSYGELYREVAGCRRYLRELGLEGGSRVVVVGERGAEVVVWMLSIISSGLVYVPVDREVPMGRLLGLVGQAGPGLVIAEGEQAEVLAASGYRVLGGEQRRGVPEGEEMEAFGMSGEGVAYVIYTSGSTGVPKGVEVTRENLNQFLRGIYEGHVLGGRGGWKMGWVASIGFDISLFQVLAPLVSGGRVEVVEREGLQEGGRLREWIGRVDTVDMVPGLYREAVGHWEGLGAGVRRVFIGGDRIGGGLLEELRGVFPEAELTVTYGPTEGTIFCTERRYGRRQEGEELRGSVVGMPVGGVEVYIVDGRGGLCPVGVAGELWIGGGGVSRGYLNDVERTAEKFVANRYGEGRVYRTGDRCRWLGDGNIEFLGRMDEQVKVRGFRIEPGEIETVLEGHPGVSRAVVAVQEGAEGQKRLVAYVSGSAGYDRQEVWLWLRSRLPEYMVPSQVVEVAELPLTANGKVDRRRLPDPGLAESGRGYEAPGTETERVLAGIWSGLLGRERIGVNDNFFEIGGDSIISIQVVSRARRQGYELQPRDLFLHQTIGKLSAMLSSRESGGARGEQGLLRGRCGLLPVQAWYLGRERAGLSHFNQSILLEVDKGVGGERLRAVWSALVGQHDGLRFVYRRGPEGWEQWYGEGPGLLSEEDLRLVGAGELGERITACCQGYQQGLDIEAGRVSCGVWIRTPEGEERDRLLVVVHHLAVDGVSWRILVEDVERLLRGEELGRKTGSYREWYGALEGYSQSRRLLGQLGYWQEVCGGRTGLPVDREEGEGEVRQGDLDHYSGELPVEATRLLLQEAGRAYRTEINDVLLSVLSGVLCGWSGGGEVVIGLEGHGREETGQQVDTSRTVGWFTTMYPVRLPGGVGRSRGERLREVKEALRRVPDKGLGYGVWRYMKGEKGLRGVEWELVFNYLGQLDQVVEGGEGGGVLRGAKEWTGESSSAGQPVGERLLVGAAVQGGRLVVRWSYSRRHYRRETIAALAGKYLKELEELIDHCVEQGRLGKVVSSPSDYGLGEVVSCGELDGFLEGQDPAISEIMEF